MISIEEFIRNLPQPLIGSYTSKPWLAVVQLKDILHAMIPQLDSEFKIVNDIAIHKSATIETGAVIKGPAIIGSNCFVAANAYLRDGVYLNDSVVIGPGCEVKRSIIMSNSHLAHFNFVGDSIVGSHVNFEAGAIVCNHWNEKADKQIKLVYQSSMIETGADKFGAIVGDNAKIGANAVLSPGTLLAKNTDVKRLELVNQLEAFKGK